MYGTTHRGCLGGGWYHPFFRTLITPQPEKELWHNFGVIRLLRNQNVNFRPNYAPNELIQISHPSHREALAKETHFEFTDDRSNQIQEVFEKLLVGLAHSLIKP
jgi:hypothetical protein